MTRRLSIWLLLGYLTVGCLHLPCYADLNLEPSRACCSQVEGQVLSDCCDTDQTVLKDQVDHTPPGDVAVVTIDLPKFQPPIDSVKTNWGTDLPPPEPPESRPQASRAPPFLFKATTIAL